MESQESSFLRQGTNNSSLAVSSQEQVNVAGKEKSNRDFEENATQYWEEVVSFHQLEDSSGGGYTVSISGDGTFLAAAPENKLEESGKRMPASNCSEKMRVAIGAKNDDDGDKTDSMGLMTAMQSGNGEKTRKSSMGKRIPSYWAVLWLSPRMEKKTCHWSAPGSNVVRVYRKDGTSPFEQMGGDVTDSDCDEGLVCFQRKANEEVPGCDGGLEDNSRTDYCTKEPPVQMVDEFPLGLCQGGCDANSDCTEGLVCFQREANEEVPGCDGGLEDNSRTDCEQRASTRPLPRRL
eukprot:scaffold6312_cov85-Cylindrotheca_fusiformis.AAC.9